VSRSLTRYAEKAKVLAKKIPWAYKIGAQAYVDKKYPRHLFIETTAKCNLSCNYCPRERDDNHMEFGLFKSIIDEASGFGPRSFSLHLFGEPLLYPKIMEAIRYIKKQNRNHVVLITTNGTHLNQYVDDLIQLETDEIIWTWRTEARFKPETIKRLKKSTLRRNGTKFRVRIIKEITPQEEIKEWEDWPCLEIRSLHNYGGDLDLSGYNVPPAPTRYPCYHLWYAPAVAVNGDILLCCADPHRKEVMGNVSRQSLADVWQNKFEVIRQSHLDGNYSGICKDCDVWKSYPDMFFNWQKRRLNGRSNSVLGSVLPKVPGLTV